MHDNDDFEARSVPIYEFYCDRCNMIFNFFSRTVNTSKKPQCPKCRVTTLSRRVSAFAVTGKAKEEPSGVEDLPIDEARMEKAMEALAGEAESISEDDPRQAANLMRKLTDMTGLELGPRMAEALRRMEGGEGPDQIEAEMGDLLEQEDPFLMPGPGPKAGHGARRRPPVKDQTLYDL